MSRFAVGVEAVQASGELTDERRVLSRATSRRFRGRQLRRVDRTEFDRRRVDPSQRRAEVAEGRVSSGKREGSLIGDPERGLAVIRTADVVIMIPRHVPEHAAEFVEVQAGNPVRAVAAQADHADLGDIRMIDRRHPAQLGHGTGVRRAELDLDLVPLNDGDPAAHPCQAA